MRLLFVLAAVACVAWGAHEHAHHHHHEEEQASKGEEAHHHDEHHHHHDEHHDHAHSAHHDHAHSHSGERSDEVDTRSKSEVYAWAIGCTAAIGVAPVAILYFVPMDSAHGPGLNTWLAFAAGGLLGDVFLHLIPHAVSPHDHSGHDHSAHDHSAHDHGAEMSMGLWILGGILVFFAVEKMVASGHSHSHSHAEPKKGKKSSKKQSKKPQGVAVSGWLNLAADFAHNFTDGLAIGASFSTSHSLGLITSAAVLLHEVPHELGDVALLLKSGMSRRGALLAQLVTAIGCVLGCVLGLLADSMAESSHWVLPFTAGGFIYIATVSVLPTLLEDHKLGQTLKELFAMMAGIASMYGIGLLE